MDRRAWTTQTWGEDEYPDDAVEDQDLGIIPSYAVPVSISSQSLPVKMWIVDTGSAFDLINKQVSNLAPHRIRELAQPMFLQTANGGTRTSTFVAGELPELAVSVEAHVLDNTPPLLSVGRRCMNDGMTFVWPAGSDPYFIRKDGMKVALSVEGYVPYITSGTQPQSISSLELQALLYGLPAVTEKVVPLMEFDADKHSTSEVQTSRSSASEAEASTPEAPDVADADVSAALSEEQEWPSVPGEVTDAAIAAMPPSWAIKAKHQFCRYY